MDNEDQFNISNDNHFNTNNNFKKNNSKNLSGIGFGRGVLIPFLSGIIGAVVVIGTCFGVPSIRERIIDKSSFNGFTTTSANTINEVNISDYSDTSVAVAKKVLPSVVGISVTYQITSFFGNSTGEATGSGIILTEDGYIVTNNHVVASESSSYYEIAKATGIKVKLYGDTQSYDATVVGTDSVTDLAVLKIDKTGLTPAVLGDSNNIRVGEFVMAIGNPLGMDYSVTGGMVSAINREVESDGTTYNAIQTDAAINSGNSGGALANSNGEVIGINTLKFSGTGVEGIGFAIPISSTTSIIQQLIQYQTVKRPYIGITGSSVEQETVERYNVPKGIYVEDVEENSPADEAGLQKSDIITKIEGKEVKSVNELNQIKYNYNIGDTVTLTVYRNNEEIEVKVKIGEQPEETENNSNNSNNNNNLLPPQNSGSIFDFFR